LIGALFLMFALLSAPAVIILLVTTNSLLHALNPMMFTRLAVRIGWGYLLMLFFLMLLGGAPAVLGHFVIRHMPVGLHPLLFAFAKNFYTIISYHMMGYVILQYHEAIGYQVDYDNFRDPANQGQPGADENNGTILNEVNVMIQEGKLDEAIVFIKNATGENGFKNLALSERYLNLLKLKKRKPEFIAHSTIHLGLLARENEKTKACRLYLQCLAADPEFVPDPSSLFKIGGWLNETGKIKESVSAFNRLVKAYPNDGLVPKAYFRAAQVFHDRLMNPERARKILNGLLQKYPEHEITPQIRTYLEHIF
jgi:tetratricopeptide (TPR) repeat protein